MKCLAKILDRVVNRLAPLPPEVDPSWLTVLEATEESTPQGALYREAMQRSRFNCPECAALFPEGWEDKLHDACAECDDEDPAPRPAGTNTVPVGTLLNLIAKTLRDNDVRPYLVPAQMVEHAINLNYRITPR